MIFDLTSRVIANEFKRWNSVVKHNDSKQLWKQINWNGTMENATKCYPDLYSMKNHFEKIYTADNPEEMKLINELNSNVNIPQLDDPITESDIDIALNSCKKGGFEYMLPVLHILRRNMLPLLLLIFNLMFYTTYPAKLACSLLFTIPKSGNLKLPGNFRGIQMLRFLGLLYDRIIHCRLLNWINIYGEQTAYQKHKST